MIDPRDESGVRNALIHRVHTRALRAGINRLGGARFTTAVDFGCGVGRLTPVLLGAADAVVGVDPSPVMRERARAAAPAARTTFVAPGELPELRPPVLIVATYVLTILPEAEVVGALTDLRRRAGSDAAIALIERVVLAPGIAPRDIEPRDEAWYARALRAAGWALGGARRIRSEASVPVVVNARLGPRLPRRLRPAVAWTFATIEAATARRSGRGHYADLLMWGRAADRA